MIQQNVKEITTIKCGNSECKKVYLNNQQIFPKRQDQPVEPEEPIITSSVVLVEFNVFPGKDIPDEEFPVTMWLSNGHSYTVGRSFSTTFNVGHEDEEGNIIIDDHSWDDGSISITTATGKTGYGGYGWDGPYALYYRMIGYTLSYVQ